MQTMQNISLHTASFIRAGTAVVIETTNGGRVFGTLVNDYMATYAVTFAPMGRTFDAQSIPGYRIRDVRRLTATERLCAWIQDHCHHAHICADGRICIGIDAYGRDGTRSTALEYVSNYQEARDALGY